MSFNSKVIAKVKFTLDRQTDGRTDGRADGRTDRRTDRVIPIYPQLRLQGV